MLPAFLSCWSSSYRQRTGQAAGVSEEWEAAPPLSAAGGLKAGFRGGGVGLRQWRVWSQRGAMSPAAPDRQSPQRVKSAAGPGRWGC